MQKQAVNNVVFPILTVMYGRGRSSKLCYTGTHHVVYLEFSKASL